MLCATADKLAETKFNFMTDAIVDFNCTLVIGGGRYTAEVLPWAGLCVLIFAATDVGDEVASAWLVMVTAYKWCGGES